MSNSLMRGEGSVGAFTAGWEPGCCCVKSVGAPTAKAGNGIATKGKLSIGDDVVWGRLVGGGLSFSTMDLARCGVLMGLMR